LIPNIAGEADKERGLLKNVKESFDGVTFAVKDTPAKQIRAIRNIGVRLFTDDYRI